jgi:hypothetical protein
MAMVVQMIVNLFAAMTLAMERKSAAHAQKTVLVPVFLLMMF